MCRSFYAGIELGTPLAPEDSALTTELQRFLYFRNVIVIEIHFIFKSLFLVKHANQHANSYSKFYFHTPKLQTSSFHAYCQTLQTSSQKLSQIVPFVSFILLTGLSTCSIFALCPHHWFHEWSDRGVKRRGYEYESLKKALGQTIWKQCEMLFPQLVGKVMRLTEACELILRHSCLHACVCTSQQRAN